MKILFVIQGEGRGHMTQALAMKRILNQSGHDLAGVCLGTSSRREIPSFFLEKIDVPIVRFRSPNLVTDTKNKGILLGKTIWKNLLQTEKYLKSLKTIDEAVDEHHPDLVVNFYEPLWGLYQRTHPGKVPSVSVAHQFLAIHPEFPFPEGRSVEKSMLRTLNSITGAGSERVLCLSFNRMPAVDDPRFEIVPPILRPALFDLKPTAGDYLLVYVMQSGYADDIIEWQSRHPDVTVHCFWDRAGAPEVEERNPNLTLHQLSDTKFLDLMAGCRGLVTTAGFESVCEAMYLGKPVLMVPVEGHYEQACNALDASRAGAGIWSDHFDLDRFMDHLPTKTDHADFRAWVDSAPTLIGKALNRAASGDR